MPQDSAADAISDARHAADVLALRSLLPKLDVGARLEVMWDLEDVDTNLVTTHVGAPPPPARQLSSCELTALVVLIRGWDSFTRWWLLYERFMVLPLGRFEGMILGSGSVRWCTRVHSCKSSSAELN